MTIQREAYEKIMKLPDDAVRLVIVLVDEIARQNKITVPEKEDIDNNMSLTRQKKAYQEMLEMKKKSTYPKDFDYKKAMEEAVNEKYHFVAPLHSNYQI